MRRFGQRVRRAAVRRRRHTVGQYIGTGGVCKTNNHKSVVGFGELPGRYTGKTCV